MKVLFLDNWTMGKRLFLPIHTYLKSQGVDTLLVHWGSFGNEPDRPKEETIDGMLVRDISWYGTRLIHKAIQKEKPDCVITLTHTKIMDRVVFMSARSLGIPSIFLMHGIWATKQDGMDSQLQMLTPELRKRRLTKLRTYLQNIFPNYFYSGSKEKPYHLLTPDPYRTLYEAFKDPARARLYPSPTNEIVPTLMLAWDKDSKAFIQRMFSVASERIDVVGHPPLDSAYNMIAASPDETERKEFLANNAIDPDKPYVLYLEGSFVEASFDGWTEESRLEHCEELVDICRQTGRELVIKLHPAVKSRDLMAEKLKGKATVIYGGDADRLVYFSDAVIGHRSTLNNTAIVMRKPLYILRWGISKGIALVYEDGVTAHVCERPEQLLEGLQKGKDADKPLYEAREDYINNFLAPFDGKSQERIHDTIMRLARKHAGV